MFKFLSKVLASLESPVEQRTISGRVEVEDSQSSQSSSSLSLQPQDYIYSKSDVGPRKILNGSSSQNDSRLGGQGMQDGSNLRLRRLDRNLS